MGINKIQYGNTTLIDLTADTVTADKLMQGYTAHDRTGAVITGTATGGGGSVTQDQDGFIVLPPDGGGSPSVGGLEYETGTWTPSEDVTGAWIPFTNTHTSAPVWYLIEDATGTYSDVLNSSYGVSYWNYHQLFGSARLLSSTSERYAIATYSYRSSSATAIGNASVQITEPYTNTGDGSNSYSRFWAKETGIKAYTTASYYWRAGRTYKWIAVWTPTA